LLITLFLFFILPTKNNLSRKNLPFSKIFPCPGIHHLKVFSLPIFDEFHGPSSEEEKQLSQELITDKSLLTFDKKRRTIRKIGLQNTIFLLPKYSLRPILSPFSAR